MTSPVLSSARTLRLVIGTRLDVSEDDDGPLSPDDPDAPAFAIYDFLGYLVDRTVAALSGR